MSDAPDIHGPARQVAVLEERMNTGQAEYESALDRLRADMASMMREASDTGAETRKRIADTNAEIQKQITTATERWWQTAALLGVMGIFAAVVIAFA